MYQHVLVPTDGSELSLRAAHTAAKLCKELNARMTAVYVIPPYTPPSVGDGAVLWPDQFSPDRYKQLSEQIATTAIEKVKAAASKAKVECDGVYVTKVHPWQGIIDTAKGKNCDLIVMASHGRKGLEGILVGSETTKVLTHSTTPVLVCR
jgi:nucleotide-binding universal stress UspA family protein